ncbi:MAG: tryptophan--tRNA ligase [Bacteriovoracaceae bacterium]|nr:tryptophan--tRNA ligase [Bacteriovoracaceae bacterium]
MTKKIILSGSTVTGNLTLGNYIGAINNWTKLQEEYECLYMVADLHALTVRQEPKELQARILSFYAQYIACGLDPKKNTLFVQSHVPAHAELQWILTTLTPIGYLNRMTQFKEKSEKTNEILAGLYMYPVLMAADILLYQANLVPVGEDQRQHLELSRDIVTFFHNRYGDTFTMPTAYIPKMGAKIMSLQDPTKKMSKSDENDKSFISIIDPPKSIEKKIKSSVTDSETVVSYDPEKKAGLANLLTIYSVLTGKNIDSIVASYQGKMYGHVKVDLAEIVVETFKPVQEKYHDLMKNQDHLLKLMKEGADKANAKANQTLTNVYKKIGLVNL